MQTQKVVSKSSLVLYNIESAVTQSALSVS